MQGGREQDGLPVRALVQLGGNFVLPVALGGGEEARAAARDDLEWWTSTAGRALETWSPA